jgi:hypothetical protein
MVVVQDRGIAEVSLDDGGLTVPELTLSDRCAVLKRKTTYHKSHGNGRRKGSEHHDAPILPALGVIAKVNDPGCDSHLHGRNLADIGPLPSGSSWPFINVVGRCDVHVAKVAIVVMKISIGPGLV